MILRPAPPPYDPEAWSKLPYAERLRLACVAWTLQGYGTPPATFLLYAIKVAAYVGAWLFFCTFSPGLEDPRAIATWWSHPAAFQKAILWSMLFEMLGLGCGSGPLTGRYVPPIGGALYFLRPGTTKLPFLPGVPIIGGHRRTVLDVALYLGLVVVLVRALLAPEVTPALVLPAVILLPVLGLGDKTLFLAARAEHYYYTAICFLWADWLPGAKIVATAVWFWAGVSKLNHHFPAVVAVMVSNSPVMRFAWLRRLMYRRHPEDLRPSGLATRMAHCGALFEFGVPILLFLGDGGWLTLVGLVMMVLLHGFITSNVPMGVPIEWNVAVVYGGFFLFGAHATTRPLSVDPLLLAALIPGVLLLPMIGNLVPRWISFLLSMRYYAGNWAYSVWLFRGESFRKLDRHLTKSSPWPLEQIERLYDRETGIAISSRMQAFRAMHLHGRALQLLLPKAVDDIDDYEYLDGELVAGLALGWNFGDGHLHDEQLLAALQAQCAFEPGELRCIMIESQPIQQQTQRWRIVDAATGRLDEGELSVAELRSLQPWPTAGPATEPFTPRG